MKKLSTVFVNVCLVSIVTALFWAVPLEAAPPTTTLTMVSQYPLTNVTINFSTRQFKKWVEAYSGGSVKIDYKGGPEIIAGSQLPKAVEQGMFDIAFVCPPYSGAQYPSFQLFNFVNQTNHRLAVRDDKVFDLMDKVARNHGMAYLGVWQAGIPAFLFLAKKPTLDANGRIESVKGLKIRSGGPFDGDLISSIGGTAVAMGPGEVYEAIRTKLIDGAMLPMNTALDISLSGIVLYAVPDAVYSINGMGFMNAKVFDQLTPDTQKLIIDVSKEVTAASYNYTLAITWDGFSSETGMAKTPALHFNRKAKRALINAMQSKLKTFAAAEPNLSKDIVAAFTKYYAEEDLPLNSAASMMR